MSTPDRLADRFEEHRGHLRAVAYRMPGWVSDADDAVQEGWLTRTDVAAERLAFVLHDAFGLSFDEIAPFVERTPVPARQLASRARRRVQAEAPVPDPDLRQQREVVDAVLAAAREGDFERLVIVLDPDIVLRADGGALKGMSRLARGIPAFAAQAATFSKIGLSSHVVLVNGNVGLLSRLPDGRLFSVIGLTIAGGRIRRMDILADAERLRRIDLSGVGV
jgi:RNA polymerase sigma-70 factor (ECF subfamily)